MVEKHEVERILDLSRLPASDEDLVKYQETLETILKAFSDLQTLSTENIEPFYGPIYEQNARPWRQDEVASSRPEMLENAPLKKRGQFVVPAFVEES